MRPKHRIAAILVTVVAAAALFSGCRDPRSTASQLKPPPTMVVVAAPVEQVIVDYTYLTGRTEAVESVELRARVTGFLESVKFVDGTEVPEGELLYEIDRREYEAENAAAVAERSAAQARQEKMTADYNRMVELRKKGAASSEEFDRADANKREADAAVELAAARVQRAELNLDFTRITAPISGVISRTQITEGNLVSADQTLLTTIVSVDPMYAYCDIDERTALTVRQMIREGKLQSKEAHDVPVELGLATETDYPHVGKLDFVDNRIDSSTGTIRVRGVFENPRPPVGNRVLVPGLFCRIRIPISEKHQALLITERAIGTDQGQKFVYVVNKENEVVFRPVKLGELHNGLRVIEDGLVAGETIIIDGLQRVRPGATVEPKAGDMLSRPEGAPPAGEGADEPEKAAVSAG